MPHSWSPQAIDIGRQMMPPQIDVLDFSGHDAWAVWRGCPVRALQSVDAAEHGSSAAARCAQCRVVARPSSEGPTATRPGREHDGAVRIDYRAVAPATSGSRASHATRTSLVRRRARCPTSRPSQGSTCWVARSPGRRPWRGGELRGRGRAARRGHRRPRRRSTPSVPGMVPSAPVISRLADPASRAARVGARAYRRLRRARCGAPELFRRRHVRRVCERALGRWRRNSRRAVKAFAMRA